MTNAKPGLLERQRKWVRRRMLPDLRSRLTTRVFLHVTTSRCYFGCDSVEFVFIQRLFWYQFHLKIGTCSDVKYLSKTTCRRTSSTYNIWDESGDILKKTEITFIKKSILHIIISTMLLTNGETHIFIHFDEELWFLAGAGELII